MPNDGAKYPKFKAKKCNGLDLRKTAYLTEIKLDYLINAYNDSPNKADFFNKFFTRLAGTEKLQAQIIAGKSATAIKTTWQDDLNAFKLIRSKYLLYK
jgi:uncharacterized protein YbbC (DUF1343 family)